MIRSKSSGVVHFEFISFGEEDFLLSSVLFRQSGRCQFVVDVSADRIIRNNFFYDVTFDEPICRKMLLGIQNKGNNNLIDKLFVSK